jgi:hypothetical protein
MVYARAHGLRFGHDVVFTYGPAAYLVMPWFGEETPVIRRTCDVVLGYIVAAGVCLLAWRMSLVWRILFIVALLLSPAVWYPFGMPELLYLIGMICWTLLARDQRWAALVLIPLLSFLALAKVSFIPIGGITVLALALLWRSPLPLIGYLVTLLAEWVLLGQRFGDIWGYVRGAYDLISGYSSSNLAHVRPLMLLCGSAALLCTAAVLWVIKLPITAKGWLGVVLFALYKHTFMRADAPRLVDFFGFASLLAVILAGAYGDKVFTRVNVSICWIVSTCAVMMTGAIWNPPMDWSPDVNVEMVASHVVENVHALAIPADFQRVTRESASQLAQAFQLPNIRQVVGNASVDVFDWDCAWATFNELNYKPRPICQSYAVYTPRLKQLNSEFYRTNPPEYVLFQINKAPGHFPPSDDTLVLRQLAMNYKPCAAEGPFVLLKTNAPGDIRIDLITSGRAAANEPISIPQGKECLWAEITPPRHFLRRLFYSEPLAQIKVFRGEEEHLFEAPLSLLAQGFLLNPMIVNTEDIYQTNSPPKAISFSDPVNYKIYRLAR